MTKIVILGAFEKSELTETNNKSGFLKIKTRFFLQRTYNTTSKWSVFATNLRTITNHIERSKEKSQSRSSENNKKRGNRSDHLAKEKIFIIIRLINGTCVVSSAAVVVKCKRSRKTVSSLASSKPIFYHLFESRGLKFKSMRGPHYAGHLSRKNASTGRIIKVIETLTSSII